MKIHSKEKMRRIKRKKKENFFLWEWMRNGRIKKSNLKEITTKEKLKTYRKLLRLRKKIRYE